MRTLRLDPAAPQQAALVVEEIERLLHEGKHVTVTVAEEQELLSPQQAGERLGFSRQHVVRLINTGALAADRLPGSEYWRIPLDAVVAFEERREQARHVADEHARALDALDAPLE